MGVGEVERIKQTGMDLDAWVNSLMLFLTTLLSYVSHTNLLSFPPVYQLYSFFFISVFAISMPGMLFSLVLGQVLLEVHSESRIQVQ